MNSEIKSEKYIYSALFKKVIPCPSSNNKEGFSSEKEALLQYYKEQSFLIKDRIRKSRENISKNEKELDSLNEEFSYLFEICPEEFL